MRNIRAKHLDIGVGTGYFLDKVDWKTENPQITLLDLNVNSLETSAHRIRRYKPVKVLANILKPLPKIGQFESVGMNFLLHCLPGNISEKSIAFDHIKPALKAGAKVFGSTIIQGDAACSVAAKALMNFYYRKGIFSNSNDTFQELEKQLSTRFDTITFKRHGSVVLFEASAR